MATRCCLLTTASIKPSWSRGILGKASNTAHCRQAQLHQRAEPCASTPRRQDHSSALTTPRRTPPGLHHPPAKPAGSREPPLPPPPSPGAGPAQEGWKHHSRCPIGFSEALVGLGMGETIHTVGRTPLRRDVRGAVVIVVLTAEAPGGHGPCGRSCIRGAQLNGPLLRFLGVSHRAERLARTAGARSPPRLLYSNTLLPKLSGSWHVPRSKVHGTFPPALPAGSCPSTCLGHTQAGRTRDPTGRAWM